MRAFHITLVMAGLDPAIHALPSSAQHSVDARHPKSDLSDFGINIFGHDE